MKKHSILQDIPLESIRKMIPCFSPIFKQYFSGETILRYSDGDKKLGVLTEGNAKLEYIDINGDASLLEKYTDGDIFGQMFSLPLSEYEYIVTATSDCKVIYLDFDHCITPCENACKHHSILINNLFMLTAQKSQELSFHISILSQHTTRKKLIAYLNFERLLNNKALGEYFQVPYTLADLAQYLSVERTAMMKEIKQMKKAGLIDSDRRMFMLNKSALEV